jgi:hypothetical protein
VVWFSLLNRRRPASSKIHLTTRAPTSHAPPVASQREHSPYLYPPLATRQAPRFRPALDFLLVPSARQYALLGLGRELVSHLEVRSRPHIHRLPLRGMAWVRVVLRHAMLRRRERRAHGLLYGLRLRWLLRLAVLQTYWREIQRRQRHAGALRRASIGVRIALALRRRVCVRGLHRGRRIGMRRRVRIGWMSLLAA